MDLSMDKQEQGNIYSSFNEESCYHRRRQSVCTGRDGELIRSHLASLAHTNRDKPRIDSIERGPLLGYLQRSAGLETEESSAEGSTGWMKKRKAAVTETNAVSVDELGKPILEKCPVWQNQD
ncbi:hypothetical protein PGTUg99_035643 [Puccinia graminis f. sp. tritici]|uniref:Uncharacterized protein n=1 Tax=Puccinia graminis f. sp. tritici TaxID=56615 RepID=A0A5B0NMT0_PUCGR|nr:hypothetical protein PGTUg99_035643 [Puccinia graminis f. sp. tritici]